MQRILQCFVCFLVLVLVVGNVYVHVNAAPNSAILGAAVVAGTKLLTGNDSSMATANSWTGGNLSYFDVGTTVAGKMYMTCDSSGDWAYLANKVTAGKHYQFSLKARLAIGSTAEIRFGRIGTPGTYIYEYGFTPSGTETTFIGKFIGYDAGLYLGRTGEPLNGRSLEIDDVSVKLLTNQ